LWGASFSGNREDYLEVNNKKLYFRGRKILIAALETLKEQFHLNLAKNFVLNGCSAGGLATYINTDFVHNWLDQNAESKVNFGSIPISGYFLLHNSIENDPVYPNQIKTIFNLSNSITSVNQECVKSFSEKNEEWKCFFAENNYPYIKSRIFVLNSALDSWQTGCIYLATNSGCQSVKQDYWKNCDGNLESCNKDQINFLNNYLNDFKYKLESKKETYQKNGNGSFIYSCHNHCGALSSSFNDYKLNGMSMQQAVSKWWNQSNSDTLASENNYEPCIYNSDDGKKRNCNPTCNPMRKIFMSYQ